ncbi:capsular polysaccharide synthesis protein [Treponema pectinovorum]|uniref:capsular polysaccharide synthesis protein n=1 Tax=Treponema pectinovorum TaxID=164 RepID=UPI0011CAA7BD|nr:capsular polysaccharide synthesis protein [Treponema pectinovorum]
MLQLKYKFAYKLSSKLKNRQNRFLDFCSINLNKYYFRGIQNYIKDFYSKNEVTQCESFNYNSSDLKNCIWICWFQGIEKAPQIVKACINSVKSAFPSKKVIILDESNIPNYINLPNHIIEKYNAGIISKQNFSDILRFALLKKYGGAWFDATIFALYPPKEDIFNYEIYSIKNKNGNRYNISRRRWTAYLWILRENENYFVNKVYDFFISYWKVNNSLIDYFLIDHIIAYLYETDAKIKNILDSIPPNNLHVSDFQDMLSLPYDESSFRKLTQDTFLAKLSWKKSYENSNEESLFHKIILPYVY